MVLGEGEETLLELVKIVESKGEIGPCDGAIIRKDGVVIEGSPRKEIFNLDSLPFPDFSDYDTTKYFNKDALPIVFSRGCSWRCAFCTTYTSWKSYRSRSACSIIDEIKLRMAQYPATRRFEICDPACNQDLEVLSSVCDGIIAEKIDVTFSSMAQIRPDMDAVLLKKMKLARFHTLNFGMESGSDRMLKSMRKLYTSAEAEKVIREASSAGINVVLNFVVGFPGEEQEDFTQTLDFIERNKSFIANVAPAHECDIIGTEICARPEEYNVKVPMIDDYIQYWETIDKKNNYEVRHRRKQEFDGFLNRIQMPIKCGVFDRGSQ